MERLGVSLPTIEILVTGRLSSHLTLRVEQRLASLLTIVRLGREESLFSQLTLAVKLIKGTSLSIIRQGKKFLL
jgi:hypothetical protein